MLVKITSLSYLYYNHTVKFSHALPLFIIAIK